MCRINKQLHSKMPSCSHVIDWSIENVREWLENKGHTKYVDLICNIHCIDGRALLLLTENDLRSPPLNIQVSVFRLSLTYKKRSTKLKSDNISYHV